MTDGVSSEGVFTVRWSIRGYYSVHYSEDSIGFRFDRQNPHSAEKHWREKSQHGR